MFIRKLGTAVATLAAMALAVPSASAGEIKGKGDPPPHETGAIGNAVLKSAQLSGDTVTAVLTFWCWKQVKGSPYDFQNGEYRISVRLVSGEDEVVAQAGFDGMCTGQTQTRAVRVPLEGPSDSYDDLTARINFDSSESGDAIFDFVSGPVRTPGR